MKIIKFPLFNFFKFSIIFLIMIKNSVAVDSNCVWYWYQTPSGQLINMPNKIKNVGSYEGLTNRICEMYENSNIEKNTNRLKAKNDFSQIITNASEKYNISYDLLDAVIWAESSYNEHAVSNKGAKGLMQLMDFTAERFKVHDVFDAESNIMGGAEYLRFLLDKYDNDVELALAGYNAGEGNVDKYGGIPPFEETQNYIYKIMKKMGSEIE